MSINFIIIIAITVFLVSEQFPFTKFLELKYLKYSLKCFTMTLKMLDLFSYRGVWTLTTRSSANHYISRTCYTYSSTRELSISQELNFL